MEFEVWNLGFGVWDEGSELTVRTSCRCVFTVWVQGVWFWGLGFEFWGFGFGVWGRCVGFGDQGLGMTLRAACRDVCADLLGFFNLKLYGNEFDCTNALLLVKKSCCVVNFIARIFKSKILSFKIASNESLHLYRMSPESGDPIRGLEKEDLL